MATGKYKNVNGVRIELTDQEWADMQAGYAQSAAIEAARDRPQEELDRMDNLIKALVKEIADIKGVTPADVKASMKTTIQGL